jgi:transposase
LVLTEKQLLKEIQEELKLLRQENKQLKQYVLELESRLEKYENPKNSGNSSIPPSQDPFRKTKSLRTKTKRKPGGQKGRKGRKLEMSSTPDKVVLHDITNCNCCGYVLPKEPEGYEARQIFDLPPIKIFVTEHRSSKKTCQHCGEQNRASFPKGLVQPAQYGNNLKALCAYLQNYQMLPYARCSEFIEDLTGHPIATGSLSNFQRQCFELLTPYQEEVKRQLLKSPVLHADETGIRLNGNNMDARGE